jgi:hypothetical protein
MKSHLFPPFGLSSFLSRTYRYNRIYPFNLNLEMKEEIMEKENGGIGRKREKLKS